MHILKVFAHARLSQRKALTPASPASGRHGIAEAGRTKLKAREPAITTVAACALLHGASSLSSTKTTPHQADLDEIKPQVGLSRQPVACLRHPRVPH